MVQNKSKKDRFDTQTKNVALGLFKNFQRKKRETRETTEAFMEHIAKNLDGRSFTLFIKLFNELNRNVLNNAAHELSPDSFLLFLQKLEEGLTSMQTVNDIVVNKLEGVDLSQVSTKALLSKYQDLSIDFQFEEKLRMGEIKQFAANVVPKSRFIFDNYKVKEDLYSEEEEPEK